MKILHGTEKIMEGGLRGRTDATDYFYFICPACPDDEILRVLDYELILEEKGNKYNEQMKSKAPKTFVIRLQLFCEACGHKDAVKVANCGWQGGKHADTLKIGEQDSGGDCGRRR